MRLPRGQGHVPAALREGSEQEARRVCLESGGLFGFLGFTVWGLGPGLVGGGDGVWEAYMVCRKFDEVVVGVYFFFVVAFYGSELGFTWRS